MDVTPFVGVWIETRPPPHLREDKESHPSWVCGLKLDIVYPSEEVVYVPPFVGVWIETLPLLDSQGAYTVTPFVGVWIETAVKSFLISSHIASHPSWVCGLKQFLISHNLIIFKSHPSWVCGLKLLLNR